MKAYYLTIIIAGITFGSTSPGLTQLAPPPSPGPGAAAAKVPGPRIQFATPTYDFGQAKAGDMVKHEFIFTNTGNQLLVVSDVRPGCGCTTTGSWDRQVEPGKTGKIPIQFNSANFGGTVMKPVTVTCNDPTQPTVTLQIKGTVSKPIDVNPMYAMFNVTSDAQTNETKVVRIVNNLPEPLTVSDLTCTNKFFKAELKTVRPGKEFEVHVTTVPPFNSGTAQAQVTLKTSSPQMPVITINAFAMVQQAVLVMPSQITLAPGPLPAATRSSVTIRNNAVAALTLSEPRLSVDGVDVQMKELQPGRMFNLTVNFPSGFQVPPGQKVELTVKSSHPSFPLIKVPVFQLPRPATAPVMPFGPPFPIRPGTSAPPARAAK